MSQVDFGCRLSLAKSFEDEVEKYINSFQSVISAVRNGTEHTHPKFVSLLRSNNSAPSKFIRFAPDGVFLTSDNDKNVWHWEAKNSICVEKDAYATYMDYHRLGCNVVVFFRKKTHKTTVGNITRFGPAVYGQQVQDIKFIPSNLVIKPFPENKQHPVDEDDWMHPRLSGGTCGMGSGTPYKVVNIDSLIPMPDFYVRIGHV